MANFEVMPQVGAAGAKVMRADTADELSEAIGSTGGSGSSSATVAGKLAAGGVEAVTGDTVADVKDMLNKLITALSTE